MGLGYPTCKFLVEAKRHGLSFKHTLTIGRQQMYVVGGEFRRLGIAKADRETLREGEYCEPFVEKYLGAERVDSLDYSDYESPTFTQDLNQAAPRELHQKYDAIVDGGTLEHIFNVPIALTNYLNMLKVGGTAYIFVPSNNCAGHGLYQFSSELFYSLANHANGVELLELALVSKGRWGPLWRSHTFFQTIAPAKTGGRHDFTCAGTAEVLVAMRKTRHVNELKLQIQQSDYIMAWLNATGNAPIPRRSTFRRLVKWILMRAGPLQPIILRLASIYSWWRMDINRMPHFRRVHSFDFTQKH